MDSLMLIEEYENQNHWEKNIITCYNEILAIENDIKNQGITPWYHRLLTEKLHTFSSLIWQVTMKMLDLKKTYHQELSDMVQAKMTTGLKKTPAQAEAEEELYEDKTTIAKMEALLWDYSEQLKIFKYVLRQNEIEMNKWQLDSDI